MNKIQKIDKIYEVIGPNHKWKKYKNPVRIGDVLDWMSDTHNESDDDGNDNIHGLIFFWNDYRKPIEDQSKECIDFIYGLLDDKKTED